MDVQALIDTLAEQRNHAMNQVAELTAHLVAANKKIAELTKEEPQLTE